MRSVVKSPTLLCMPLLFGFYGCDVSLADSPDVPEAPIELAQAAPAPPPVVSGGVVPLSSQGLLEDEQNTISIFEAAAPATVFVTQRRQMNSWTQSVEVESGSGSGFIWDENGHIVTNYHVIDGARTLVVSLQGGREHPATFVGGDPRKDIAVLRIEGAKSQDLQPILRDPEQTLQVGQKAIAIGNPYGLDHTLTTGVISALGRDVVGYGSVTIKDMIQTDASINPGNSGGPLLNSSGELIGMNTMIFSQSGSSAGIGFAVPASTIERVVNDIIENGYVTQVGFGITIVDDALARRAGINGVVIQSVMSNSPAEGAGLIGLQQNRGGTYPGDVIIRVGDTEVRSYDDIYTALDGRSPGERVSLTVLRDNLSRTVEVELYELPRE